MPHTFLLPIDRVCFALSPSAGVGHHDGLELGSPGALLAALLPGLAPAADPHGTSSVHPIHGFTKKRTDAILRETAPSAINVALTLPFTLLPCSLQMLQLCWHDYPVGRSVMMTAMGLGVVLKLWLG